jgi:hypothetical protein
VFHILPEYFGKAGPSSGRMCIAQAVGTSLMLGKTVALDRLTCCV